MYDEVMYETQVISKTLKNKLSDKIADELLSKYVPKIKEMIIQEYEMELVAPVTDRRSKTNPAFYQDEFQETLDGFQYVSQDTEGPTLVVPDIENMPWARGRLRIIKNILEGIIGSYVEVNEEQYSAMYNKKPISSEPYDDSVPAKERIYLLRYTSDVQRRELTTFRGRVLVPYPFSNSPPVRLFDPVNKFVNDNISSWIDDIIQDTIKELPK